MSDGDKNVPIISAHIPDAYYLRNAIQTTKALVTEGNLRFYNDRITFEKLDASESVLVIMTLEPENMINYTFSATVKDDESDEVKEVNYMDFGISLDSAQKVTKLLPKKSSAHLYIHAGDNNIYIKPVTASSQDDTQDSVTPIPTRTIEPVVYTHPFYKNGPIVKLSSGDAAAILAKFLVLKASTVAVHGYEKGIMLEGLSSNGTVLGIHTLGQCDNDNQPKEVEEKKVMHKGRLLRISNKTKSNVIKVKSDIIKALSKINNISGGGIVRFFMEVGQPLTISTRICGYGTYSVSILDK